MSLASLFEHIFCLSCNRRIGNSDFTACLKCTAIWHTTCCKPQTESGFECDCTSVVSVRSGVAQTCLGIRCGVKNTSLCKDCIKKTGFHLCEFLLSQKGEISMDTLLSKGGRASPLPLGDDNCNYNTIVKRLGAQIITGCEHIHRTKTGYTHIFLAMLDVVCNRGLPVSVTEDSFSPLPVISPPIRRDFKLYVLKTQSNPGFMYLINGSGSVVMKTKYLIHNKQDILSRLKWEGNRGIVRNDIYCEYSDAYKDLCSLEASTQCTTIGDAVFYTTSAYDVVPGFLEEWGKPGPCNE